MRTCSSPTRSGTRCGADAGAGGVAGPGGGAQDGLLVFGNAATIAGDLDDSGPDTGVLDALLNLLDEQGGHLVDGRAPEDARDGQVVAGAGDGVDAGPAADVLHQRDVAPEVEGGDVDDGATPPS